MSFRIILVALLTTSLSGLLPAATSVLGVVTANGNFWLDHSQVAGNGTVFDGSLIETGKDMSDIALTAGWKVRLGADSRGQLFAGRLRLQQGAGQVAGSKFLVETRGLRVLPVGSGAVVRVALGPGNLVEVAAITGSFHVETAAGIRVANMSAGAALSFTEQAGAAPPTVLCGDVGLVDGRLMLTDKVSGVTVELVGDHLESFVGKSISVTGNRSGNDALHVLVVKRDACGGGAQFPAAVPAQQRQALVDPPGFRQSPLLGSQSLAPPDWALVWRQPKAYSPVEMPVNESVGPALPPTKFTHHRAQSQGAPVLGPWILLWFGVSTIWVEGRWAVSLLEAATFLWVAVHIRKFSNPHWSIGCLAGVAALGITQIACHQTVSPADTESAILYWLAAACWVALGALVRDPEYFLDGLLWFGAALSVLELAQLYSSHGQILWFIPTQESIRIFGTFPNPNHYAAFVELLFPLALSRSFRHRQRGWIYTVVAAVMYGSVVASASRAGTILVTLELAVVIAWMARRNFRWRLVLALSCVAAFALAAGPETVWQRLLVTDPFAVRREYLESALAMFQTRPITGFGLGTWTSAYPAYAVADFGVIANHAHSEWGQWAAEGGLGVLLTLGALFVLALRQGFRNMWAIGLAAVMLHAAVDYPLVRLGLGCWWFVLLGLTVRDDKWTLQPR